MSEQRPYTAGKIMGLVLALRLVCGGVALFVLALLALALLWDGTIPDGVSLVLMFGFYLFAVGNVLLVFRVRFHSQRCLLLAPLVAVAPLAQEAVRSSVLGVSVIMALAAFFYFEGLRQEAVRLNKSKSAKVLRRLQGLCPLSTLLVSWAPTMALAVSLALVPGFFFACRLWLRGLRAELAALDESPPPATTTEA